MKSRSLKFAVVAALIALGYSLGRFAPTVVHAQAQPETMDYHWGGVVGTLPNAFIMQDSTNTIRIVDMKTLKVERQINRQ